MSATIKKLTILFWIVAAVLAVGIVIQYGNQIKETKLEAADRQSQPQLGRPSENTAAPSSSSLIQKMVAHLNGLDSNFLLFWRTMESIANKAKDSGYELYGGQVEYCANVVKQTQENIVRIREQLQRAKNSLIKLEENLKRKKAERDRGDLAEDDYKKICQNVYDKEGVINQFSNKLIDELRMVDKTLENILKSPCFKNKKFEDERLRLILQRYYLDLGSNLGTYRKVITQSDPQFKERIKEALFINRKTKSILEVDDVVPSLTDPTKKFVIMFVPEEEARFYKDGVEINIANPFPLDGGGPSPRINFLDKQLNNSKALASVIQSLPPSTTISPSLFLQPGLIVGQPPTPIIVPSLPGGSTTLEGIKFTVVGGLVLSGEAASVTTDFLPPWFGGIKRGGANNKLYYLGDVNVDDGNSLAIFAVEVSINTPISVIKWGDIDRGDKDKEREESPFWTLSPKLFGNSAKGIKTISIKIGENGQVIFIPPLDNEKIEALREICKVMNKEQADGRKSDKWWEKFLNDLGWMFSGKQATREDVKRTIREFYAEHFIPIGSPVMQNGKKVGVYVGNGKILPTSQIGASYREQLQSQIKKVIK